MTREAPRPRARRGLVVRELGEETLVYDGERHRAHSLNRTAGLVFRHADGQRSARDIARLLDGGSPAEREAVVAQALAQLAEARLVEAPSVGAAGEEPAVGSSRREVIRRAGVAAALLLPVVASVLVPTPAEAAATCVSNCLGKANGTPCSCFNVTPCPAVCVADACSDGGGC